MSSTSIGSLRAAAAIIRTEGPTIAAAAIKPTSAGAPIPAVITVANIPNAAAPIIAITPMASIQKSGSFIALTKSSPNCLNFDSASRANCSNAALASAPILSNPSLIFLPTSSNTLFMSSPNLRNASLTPFLFGSNARANAPFSENRSFNPASNSLTSASKSTRPRISFPRIACKITSPPERRKSRS